MRIERMMASAEEKLKGRQKELEGEINKLRLGLAQRRTGVLMRTDSKGRLTGPDQIIRM